MRAAIVLNPKAGQNRTLACQSEIVGDLRKLGYDCEMWLTVAPGDGCELARKAVDRGFNIVIAAGGDGTVNDVANGLVGSGIPMGILPVGTVNVLARELGIPLSPRHALRSIADGQVRNIDLGVANGRYFTLMAGVGFDAEVVSTVLLPLKGLIGATAYVLKGLEKLATYGATHVTLEMPDQTYSSEAFLVIIANSSTYTYRLKIAPYACPDDGLLDVCVFEKPILDRLGFARLVADVFANRHMERDEISYFRTSSVKVRSEPDVMVQLDGDPFAPTPVDITVSPGILPIIVPPTQG